MLDKSIANQLVNLAIQAREQSYSPYSNFRVGAALLTGSGQIYQGCNVENASYGAGICAERTAAVKAISAGEREFTAVAIVGYAADADAGERGFAYPCGICRQFLNEFAVNNMPVYVAKSETDFEETTLKALLPQSFGPSDLK